MTPQQPLTACIGCGCTEMTPCEVQDGACSWIQADHDLGVGVCSKCPETLGLFLIAQERQRQIHKEGFDAEHDDHHTDMSMAMAAAWYAAPCEIYRFAYPTDSISDRELEEAWPTSWDESWDKKELHDRIKQLQIAGALIAAEIERLYRAGDHR